jgi:hypothetical protein
LPACFVFDIAMSMLKTPYPDVRREALLALAAGDPQRAFSLFRWALEYPGHLGSYEAFQDALWVFAQIAAAIAEEEFAKHVEKAARDPNDVEALVALGAELIDQSLHGIAATLLARAHALEPGREAILVDFIHALEGIHQNHEACRVLREAGRAVEESFVCRNLLAFNALMAGDIEEPRRLLPALEAMAQRRSAPDNNFYYLARQLRQMLERAAAVRDVSLLDERDLRGWHFIINGGLLLHLSPYGFYEGMNGRYAYTHDSEARCFEAILRLEAVLSAFQIVPPRVYVLPDRDSAVLAHATAHLLEVPAEPWASGGSERPGLIVAYDLDRLDADVLQTLSPQRPGQLLFCHASCWTAEPPFVADITTYFYQRNKAPWQTGIVPVIADDERGSDRPTEDATETLAARILSATLEEGALADLPALLEFAAAMAKLSGDAAAGAFRAGGNRRRQRKDSPVKSSHLQD